MQEAFPGTALPANVVVKAPNVNAPAVREAITRLEQRALATGRMKEPITVDVNENATVANITVPIDGSGTDASSNAGVATLRSEIVPATVGALPNVEAGVTGLTAEWKDGTDEIKSKTPLVVAFVLLFAFGLMLFAFRSLVIAAKAILLGLLSVAAAWPPPSRGACWPCSSTCALEALAGDTPEDRPTNRQAFRLPGRAQGFECE
jgi:RND superfamily putative drug exporter